MPQGTAGTRVLDQDSKAILSGYRSLMRVLFAKSSKEELSVVRKALEVSMDAHDKMRRKSGEPYILHPIEVARIVVEEIGLGALSATAALLHDVVEDSSYTLEDVDRLFGEKIARIVDGLTKISDVFDPDSSQQAENFRKMILTLGEDVRVIFIKLADRLHNMRTLESMPSHKQVKIASETLFIYAPIAHRLGLYNLKSEMEDLSLKYTEPEVYRDIAMKVKAIRKDEIRMLKHFISPIKASLKKEGMDFTIKERTKSIFSIRKKMINQGVSFDEVYDKFAIRIIINVPSEEDEKASCWKAYAAVTDFYRPNPDRLRDWISSPKSNGYESLHITVMGPNGHWVEVQVRTLRMDEEAEKGLASHWKYKEDEVVSSKIDGWLSKVREVLENPELNAMEFVDDFKLNLFAEEIFVFTPRGELKTLPKGSCPIDFAFEIHTDVGLSTLGAKVNGKLVPLNYKIKSGDQVEILTSAKLKPKEEWLNYVATSKARSKIRSNLREERMIVAERGKEIVLRKLRALKVKMNPQVEQRLYHFLKLHDSQEMYYQAGLGLLDNQELKNFARERNSVLYQYFGRGRVRKESPEKKNSRVSEDAPSPRVLVFGEDEQELDHKLSPCCHPIEGDHVFGLITSTDGIKVHRKDCPNAIAIQSRIAHRVMKARWISKEVQEFVAVLHLKGMDTKGLINRITQIISNDLDVNIRSIELSSEGEMFDGSVTLLVRNKVHLQHIMETLQKVEGIEEVDRFIKKSKP